MTGDAPQPGETPRNESEPWSFPDPNTAWWRVEVEREQQEAAAARPRHPRRRPASTTPANAQVMTSVYGGPTVGVDEPAFAPEALDAHAAGAQDVAQVFDAPLETPPAAMLDAPPAALLEAEREHLIERAEAIAAAKAVEAHQPAPEPIERDHERRPHDRYLPPAEDRSKTDEGYAVSTADEARADAPADPVAESPAGEETDPPDAGERAEGVPDVMVLPEPQRDRPTVVLDRGPVPVPGQAATGHSRLGRTAAEARRERMENHPFWLNEEERAAAGNAWPAPEVRQRLAESPGPADGRRGRPPLRTPGKPRGPVAGLLGLISLALIASFFSWVSAEPFWLAVGHGDRGVATVAQCTGTGVTQRCRGAFTSADGGYAAEQVTLLGVDVTSRDTGAITPARMVSPDSTQAFAGNTGWMVHLRWVLGFVLVLLCGYGIAGLTGARRLETARARRGAVLISLAGPILLLAGFLAAAY